VTGVNKARRKAFIDANLTVLLFMFFLLDSTINKCSVYKDIIFYENIILKNNCVIIFIHYNNK